MYMCESEPLLAQQGSRKLSGRKRSASSWPSFITLLTKSSESNTHGGLTHEYWTLKVNATGHPGRLTEETHFTQQQLADHLARARRQPLLDWLRGKIMEQHLREVEAKLGRKIIMQQSLE